MCDTLYECFLFTLDRGLRAGGGIGDAVQTPPLRATSAGFFDRLVFDLSFFSFVIIILLNGVVFGIIVDSFGELRDRLKEKVCAPKFQLREATQFPVHRNAEND